VREPSQAAEVSLSRKNKHNPALTAVALSLTGDVSRTLKRYCTDTLAVRARIGGGSWAGGGGKRRHILLSATDLKPWQVLDGLLSHL
jgi:hypothetical protein